MIASYYNDYDVAFNNTVHRVATKVPEWGGTWKLLDKIFSDGGKRYQGVLHT